MHELVIDDANITERMQLQALDNLLHNEDQQVLCSSNMAELLQFVCTEVTQRFNYQLTWICKKNNASVSIATLVRF